MPIVKEDAGAALSEEDARLSEMLIMLDPERANEPEPYAPKNGLVTLAAGEFASEVERIWSGPRIAQYFSAPDARRQIWHAWLASDRAALGRKFRSDPDEILGQLTTAKGRELIEAGYGGCPRGFIPALGKCGSTARSKDFYRALFAALAREDVGAKFLRHCASLPNLLVLNVAALPTRLQSRPFFGAVRTGAIAAKDMAQFAWAATRLEAMGVAGGAPAIFGAAKPRQALHEALHGLPFPPPPWPGDAQIRPIGSRKELDRVGRKLGNCMKCAELSGGSAIEVVQGATAYYEWKGEEPGLLRFRYAPPFGWRLDEARGAGNRALSGTTWGAIERALAGWEDLAPVWVSSDGEVLCGELLRE